MTLRTLIVDDEPLAREGVEMLLAGWRDVEVVGSVGDGASAVAAIRRLRPDLVFLDIRMPEMSGLDVVDAIGSRAMPAVVFLTAYEEHALDAFRANAVDYLLKPLDETRLAEALDRVRSRLGSDAPVIEAERLEALLGALAQAPGATDGRLAVREGGRVVFVPVGEIRWVEAAGDYVTIHTPDRRHLVRESLAALETRLAAAGFQRVHRSSLVNLHHVAELSVTDGGDYESILTDGTRVRVSRGRRDALFRRLGIEP